MVVIRELPEEEEEVSMGDNAINSACSSDEESVHVASPSREIIPVPMASRDSEFFPTAAYASRNWELFRTASPASSNWESTSLSASSSIARAFSLYKLRIDPPLQEEEQEEHTVQEDPPVQEHHPVAVLEQQVLHHPVAVLEQQVLHHPVAVLEQQVLHHPVAVLEQQVLHHPVAVLEQQVLHHPVAVLEQQVLHNPVAVLEQQEHEQEPVLEDQEEEDGFTLVRSRKFGMIRGLYPEGPYISPPDHICENVLPWLPKVGPMREVKKWAQARRGGFMGTPDGLAYFSYGTYGPYNNLEF